MDYNNSIIVIWVLNNLWTLRQGEWPDPTPVERPPHSNKRAIFTASFIGPAEAAGEVERRLSMCGLDGFLVKQIYAWDESVEYLSSNLHISRKQIERGVKAALNFITGDWPKEYNYYINKAHLSEVTRHKEELSGKRLDRYSYSW